MIRLIASDIDGTLVRDGEHQMNPEFFHVIMKLREKGIQFAAASGRQWASVEKIFWPVKEKIFYLSDNGAYVGCHGRNLFLNTIARDDAMEMVKGIRRVPGLEAMIGGPDVVYVDTKNQDFINLLREGYQFRTVQVEDITKVEDQIIKVSAYRKEKIQEAVQGLADSFGSRLKMTISGDMWLDCMAPGVCKGQAVRLLQESLEIKPEETMVFGDQLNDLEMMEQAYYSFAVANAREEVKKAARFQADSNVNGGVLKILKLLLS